MLRHLRIENLILIDSAEIPFEPGLNVLSGDSGSGKSAIMTALSLVLGARADNTVIRQGTSKAFIEAIFDPAKNSPIHSILTEAGIEHDQDEYLVIKREISAGGKNRSFINQQMASLQFIQKVGSYLVDIVGQHASQKLLSLSYHREVIDTYGRLNGQAQAMLESWNREQSLRAQLQSLLSNESQRLRDIDRCQMELEELVEANLSEGEEEEIFAEYSRLSHTEELTQGLGTVQKTFSEGTQPILPSLHKSHAILQRLSSLDPGLDSIAKTLHSLTLELEEATYTLRNYYSKLEHDPSRLSEIDQRLKLINQLKRKYGTTFGEIQDYQKKTALRLKELENSDTRIEELKTALEASTETCSTLASTLSEKRKKAAAALEKEIIGRLRPLNLPHAIFKVNITPQPRGPTGDDRIEFFIAPNLGYDPLPLKNCASGGELSRVLLALKSVLADSEASHTLIFDEVDANIGGETGTIVGKKLRDIGGKHQLICITHLPQVAIEAHHHLHIAKREENGRTRTGVTVLNKKAREKELARMAGASPLHPSKGAIAPLQSHLSAVS